MLGPIFAASLLPDSAVSGILNFVMAACSIHWRSDEERRNFLVSMATSLAVHAVGIVIWMLLATMMFRLNQALMDQAREEAIKRIHERQIPTLFVEVSPDQVVNEIPEDTPYYSTANTKASNPDPADADQTDIDGSQTQMLKTFDVLQPQPDVLEPQPPPQIVEELKPLPEPSDLIVGPKPEPKPLEEPSRPRTLVEARLRRGIQVGPKIRQPGGVNQPGVIAVNAKASPFGAYDAALIDAVQKRWYDLYGASAVAPRPGRVVVQFTLHRDGRVTDVTVAEHEVGEILALYCRKAITDPAPFAPWPDQMQRLLGRDYRDVRFTFHYF